MTRTHNNIMCLWILIIAMLAISSESKKDLYRDMDKEERIIGGSFVSCCVVYY